MSFLSSPSRMRGRLLQPLHREVSSHRLQQERARTALAPSLNAVRSAAAWWMQQSWITAELSRTLKRRKLCPDRRPGAVPSRGRAAAHPQGHQPPRAHHVADALGERNILGEATPRAPQGPALG